MAYSYRNKNDVAKNDVAFHQLELQQTHIKKKKKNDGIRRLTMTKITKALKNLYFTSLISKRYNQRHFVAWK